MKLKIFYAIALVFLINFLDFSEGKVSESSPNANKTDILQTWIKMDKKIKSTVQSLIKQLMPMVLEASERMNLTSQCSKDLLTLITGLRSLKKWAFSFVDSSAKSLDGILSHSVSNYGVYDQCIETVVPDPKNKDGVRFRGQYCRVDFRLPLPPKARSYAVFDRLEELRNFTGTEVMMEQSKNIHLMYYFPLAFGFCIPSSCTEDDFSQILNIATEDYYLTAKVKSCEVMPGKTKLKGIQIFALICCLTLACLLLIGTFLEVCSPESQSTLHKYLRCFSAIKNFKKVVSTKTTSKELRCVHGIRFLSMSWVCFGHAYFYPAWYMPYYRTLSRVQEIAREPFAQTIINSSMVVNSFLFMSGLLVTYMTIKHVKIDKKNFNIPQYIIHRFWRLCPLYYFALLCIYLVPLTGSGPVFKETIDDAITPCFEHGWKNFIFINNFYDMHHSCMMHNWYVACDLQLYLVSILIFLAFLKSEKLGLAIIFALILFSMFYSAIITHFVTPVFSITMNVRDMEDILNGNRYLYSSPITRGAAYFIGVLVGYILVTRPKLKISKVTQICGWCLATVTMLMIIYSTAFWFNVHLPTEIEILFYSSFYTVAFTSGVAWMTFCCISGRGGFINKILSWKAWVPLSKLTFGMYVTESVFQTAYISNFRSPQEYSHLHFIIQAFGFMCISALLALLLSLLVEVPFMELEKLIFRRPSRDSKEPKTDKDIGLTNGTHTRTEEAYGSYRVTNMDNQAFDGKE